MKNSARLEVNGDYREYEDPIRRNTVVRINGRVVDQNSGRLLSEYSVDVDNLTSIAGLIGATMVVALEPLREERERAIREGIQKPSTMSPRRGSRPAPRARSRSRSWSAPPVAESSDPARPRSPEVRPT